MSRVFLAFASLPLLAACGLSAGGLGEEEAVDSSPHADSAIVVDGSAPFDTSTSIDTATPVDTSTSIDTATPIDTSTSIDTSVGVDTAVAPDTLKPDTATPPDTLVPVDSSKPDTLVVDACADGQKACSGACIDVLSDDKNCGDCRNHCTMGRHCNGGICR